MAQIMNAPVWRAVEELAAVWRSSPFVREYAAGVGIANVSKSAHHIEAQPFYLSIYLPTTIDYELVTRSAGTRAWLTNSELLGDAYTVMIEWLRSRLPGYPFFDSPQLAHTSPWTSYNVSMHVPWLIGLRRQQLQLKTTPPTIPFLDVTPARQLVAGAQLGKAIVSSPPAVNLRAAQQELTEADWQQLRNASIALSQARYPEPDDRTGSEDFREVAWSEYKLDMILRACLTW
jgi:hypothetical protein